MGHRGEPVGASSQTAGKAVVCERFEAHLLVSRAAVDRWWCLSRVGAEAGPASHRWRAVAVPVAVLRSAVGATDKRPFSRGEREDYSDGVFGHWTLQQVLAEAMGGHEPRLWMGQRTGLPSQRPRQGDALHVSGKQQCGGSEDRLLPLLKGESGRRRRAYFRFSRFRESSPGPPLIVQFSWEAPGCATGHVTRDAERFSAHDGAS